MQRNREKLHLIYPNNTSKKKRMKKINRIIIAMVAGIAALASCQKDETLRYNNATMGNVVNGQFISDQGNRFNVVEQICAGKLDTMKRAFIICDVLNAAEGNEEFDVRLSYVSPVLTKDAVPSSEINDLSTLKNDPILLTDMWISGGYVNLYMTIPVARSSNKPHEITFVLDQKDQTEGLYTFLIRHNASGEVLKENADNSGMVLAGAYASFPVSSIIKEDTAKIRIKWQSYMVAGQGIVSAKSEEYTADRAYVKGSFEHVPSTAMASKSSMEIR